MEYITIRIVLPALLAGVMAKILLAAEPVVSQEACRQTEGRTIISMNGAWQIAESVSSNDIPAAFDHTVVVPGLVNQAKPSFPEVDLFASHYYFKRFARKEHNYPWGETNSMLRAGDPLPVIGLSVNQRNYFWYRKTFAPPVKREVALLKIGKSQFGTRVWLNGKPVGEHLSCWTAGFFNLTDAMNWSGDNQLIVRIGAHPAVLPENIPGAGVYSSKHKWTPGIYDDASLILCDNPVIETIQVAPRRPLPHPLARLASQGHAATIAKPSRLHHLETLDSQGPAAALWPDRPSHPAPRPATPFGAPHFQLYYTHVH